MKWFSLFGENFFTDSNVTNPTVYRYIVPWVVKNDEHLLSWGVHRLSTYSTWLHVISVTMCAFFNANNICKQLVDGRLST